MSLMFLSPLLMPMDCLLVCFRTPLLKSLSRLLGTLMAGFMVLYGSFHDTPLAPSVMSQINIPASFKACGKDL